jgi:hypothetical protein
MTRYDGGRRALPDDLLAADEETYSCTLTIPDDAIAKVSA